MKSFIWSGFNQNGQRLSGQLQADDLTLASAQLKQQQIVVLSLRRKSIYARLKRAHRITAQHIGLMTRQLAVMIKAGLPIITALTTLRRGQRHQGMRSILQAIKTDIENGSSIAQAFSKQAVFDSVYCHLLESGELSGQFDMILARLADEAEKKVALKRKVKKAFTYPIAVLVVAMFVTGILLVYVIPQFENLFADFGASLPWLTQCVIDISRALRHFGCIGLAGIGLLSGGLVLIVKRYQSVALWLEKRCFSLPLLGGIWIKSAIARFASTLAMTLGSGVPLVDALNAAANTTGSLLYVRAVRWASGEVASGQALSDSLAASRLFPDLVIEMLRIGEQSGQLDDMLSKVSSFYEAEVDLLVDRLNQLLEPVIMSILGGLIGGLVVAMYLPIFQLGNVVQ